jgi:hypothetical protein
VHEQKRIVIAATISAAIASFGFMNPASAQKDAAEKAQEGGIEHWIEYYKAEQRKSSATSPRESTAPPVERAAPAERSGSGASPPGKTN